MSRIVDYELYMENEPKKVGRKAKPDKNVGLSLSVTIEDKAKFEAVADALGLSKAEYFRLILREFEDFQKLKARLPKEELERFLNK